MEPDTPLGATDPGPAPLPQQAGPDHARPASRLPWVVAAVAVLVALSALAFAVVRPGLSPDTEASRERGSSSPEQAVRYLVDRLAHTDGAGATSAFAVEHLVEGYSFQAQAERLQSVGPKAWLPSAVPGYRAISVDERRGDVAFELHVLVRAIVAPDQEIFTVQELSAGSTAADLEADLAPDPLVELRVASIDVVSPAGARVSEHLRTTGEAFGADEVQEVAVLLDTDSGLQLTGMRLVRYGSDWYVWDVSSAVIDVGLGEVRPTTEAEYRSIVEDAASLR